MSLLDAPSPHTHGADGVQPAQRSAGAWRDAWCIVALATLGLCIAWVSAPRAIQAGDAGEFTTVMLRGGIPHPSGYPWMRLLGLPARVLESAGLPGPLAAALPAALLGWVGWCVLTWSALQHVRAPDRCPGRHDGAHEDGGPPNVSGRAGRLGAILATSVIALVATSGLAILHVHDAEVWGPLVFFLALVVHVGSSDEPARPLRLGLVLGLATSHHLTAVLLTPFVVGAAWPNTTTWRALLRTLGVGLTGVVLGLSPLLTLFVGARTGAWRWGDTSTLDGWLHHVLRRDFGTFRLGLQEVAPPYASKLHREFASVGESLLLPVSESTLVTEGSNGWIATLLGVTAVALAAVLLLRGRARRPASSTGDALPRIAEDPPALDPAATSLLPLRASTRWGMLVSLACAVAVFPAFANLDPRSPFSAWILERFDLLPLVLLAWVLAIAAGRAATRLAPALAAGLASTLVAVVVIRALANVAAVAPAHEAGVEAYARDVLASPDDAEAIIFGTDDHRTFPALYVATVAPPPNAARYVDASLLAHGWYRARFAPSLELLDKPVASMDRVLRPTFAAWAAGEARPGPALYVTHPFSRPVAGLPLEPEGILWRVAIDPTLDRSVEAVVARHEAALARCTSAGAHAAGLDAPRAHPWSSDLLGARAAPTRSLLERLQHEGREDLAARVLSAWTSSHGD